MFGLCFKLSLQISRNMIAVISATSRNHMAGIMDPVGFAVMNATCMLTKVGFADYFEQQNLAISEGKIHAEEINLIALGINNGWFDAAIQEIGFINFSEYNSYYPLINETIYKEYLNASETLCVPPTLECQSINPNVELEQCFAAQNACVTVDNYYSQYYPNIDPYDIRQSGTGNIFPPETYVNYLQNPAIQKAIGALVEYQECPDAPGEGFFYTADGKFPTPQKKGYH